METGAANRSLPQLLAAIRQGVDDLELDRNRLPGWVSAANVRMGWVNDSLVAVFEDALDEDAFRTLGLVHLDSVVLLDVSDFMSRRFILPLNDKAGVAHARTCGLILMMGESTGTTLAFAEKSGGFFNAGYCGYFSPHGLLNLFLMFDPEEQNRPSVIRFVPFALYIHRDDIGDAADLIQRCAGIVLGALKDIHDSETGDYYASITRRFDTYGINLDNGVIVLGSYAKPEKQELVQVRDDLRRRGYEAHLVEDLPEHPLMSLTEKVSHWTGGSRFCVMVDREPSGHLNEFEILKNQKKILALLRRRGSGSTRMIGTESFNYSFIKEFAFDESALEVIESATRWAEAFADERIQKNMQDYPWKAKGRAL